MNLVGALFAIPQIIIGFSHDVLAGWFHIAWMLGCLLSLPIHQFFGFQPAKLVSFSLILIFGHLAAARIGPDSLPHLASFGITVFIFIIYDVRKDWGFLLFFLLLESAGLILVESKVLYVGSLHSEHLLFQRIFLIVGILFFVLLEFIFFIRLTQTNERKIIHELQHVNEELAKSNEENRLLLKEVHHRVKNNLQLVSSLLNLQSLQADNEELTSHFNDAASRIRSIALLHQKVYQGETLNDINFSEYIEAVMADLLRTYCPEKQIRLSIKSDISKLDNEALMPLALIFNELISNTIKHGIRDINEGIICTTVESLGNENYKITYADSGTWIEQSSKQSLGLELIRSLAEQLEGSLEIVIEGDKVRFIINFKLKDK